MASQKRPWAAALLSLAVLVFSSCSSNQKVQPKLGPMIESVYGIGTVTARHTYDLKIGVTDTLARLYAQEGDSVLKGKPLVAFSDGRMVAAPFAGVVTSVTYKEGETIFPQIPVLVLTDLKNPYVVVSLEQSGALRVKSGQETFLSFENLRAQKLGGKVTSIYPKDGQFYVNIEVEGMPAEVLVGMTADVAIQVAKKEKVLQVPLVAVKNGQVRISRKGVSKTLPVKIGAVDGTWAEILEGDLHPEDTLLVPRK
jgi:membrane fusion protein, macrolide-specific efflux system